MSSQSNCRRVRGTSSRGACVGEKHVCPGSGPVFEPLESRLLLSTTVGGVAWQDLNGDGVPQSGEAGLAGVHVELFSAGPDQQVGGGDDVSLGVQTTDANGQYAFEGLPSGAYYLKFTSPPGYVLSPQNPGASDADSSSGLTGVFSLTADAGDVAHDEGLISDNVPPQVTAVDPLPAEGGTTTAAVDRLTVTLSETLDPATVATSAFDLREAGPDGIFGTADDVVYGLTPDPAYTTGATVGLVIQGGPLPSGSYQFTATPTLTDRAGNALDGNGDGTGGDAYVRTFSVALPSGYVLEGSSDESSATATALPLAEDPLGSGYFVGRGLGSIQSGSDQDWWSFQASAGDIVSVSVDAPDSSLNPYVSIADSSGNTLASDDDSGPGTDAFVSHYAISTDGTYYLELTGSDTTTTGSYDLRVDLARGIQLESDANYSNGTIAGANVLTATPGAGLWDATVAGTIMAPEGPRRTWTCMPWARSTPGPWWR